MGRRKKLDQEKKRKRVTVELAPRQHTGKTTEPYKIMDALIKSERADLKVLNLAILWRSGWHPDADGVLRLGQFRKRSDLDRALGDYDGAILLNREAWEVMDPKHKERLIFHELEHCQLCIDKNGENVKDDKGRYVVRTRRHDREEFLSVIRRYGADEDLSAVVQAALADAQRPLLKEMEKDG